MKLLRIAHRGSSEFEPENTLGAFKKSLRLEVDMVELDIRVCKSGELVVFHDISVERTTNGKGKVRNLTLAQLKTFVTANNEHIPTFEEALNLLLKKTVVNIDIKTAKALKPLIHTLRVHMREGKIAYTDFVLSSGNLLVLRKLRKLDPNFQLSLIVRFVPKIMTRLGEDLHLFSVQPLAKILSKQYVSGLQKKGIKVFPWTLTKEEDGERFIRFAKSFHPDGIISFLPEKI
jgi:glycerophosphoryl diester phosphodiesterase